MPERNSLTPRVHISERSQERRIRPDLSLILPERAPLPEALHDARYKELATNNGLTIFQKQKPTLEIIETKDIPQRLQKKKKKELKVPLTVWITTPKGALNRLAEETNNKTVKELFQIQTKVREKKEGRIDKRWKQLQEKSYSEQETKEKQKETDAFLATAIKETSTLMGTKEHTQTLTQMTEIADLVRFQTKTMQIQAPETVEAIVEMTSKQELSKSLLDLLTRFDIPPSLAGELLPIMDKSKQLTHPLAWHLLDKLPKDHPFKQNQRKYVKDIKALLTGEITPANLHLARVFSEHVVSVYVDPETENPKDMVGLEFENVPSFEGVSVPDGTTLGQDSGLSSIPELRLDDKDDVLKYGKAWRERYYQIYLWSQIAQTREASLHVHINKQKKTDIKLYKMLFGFDYTRVIDSYHGTVEVKGTALAGYNDQMETGAKGFSSVYMPEFVELLYSLREQRLASFDKTNIPEDRFAYFTKLVQDPTGRAAMLLATKGEAGLQVRNPKRLEEEMGFDYSRPRLAERSIPSHSIIDAIRENNHEVLTLAAELVDEVAPPLHKNLVDYAISTNDQTMLHYLSGNIELLEPTLHKSMIEHAIKNHNASVLTNMISHIQQIDPNLYSQLVDYAVTKSENMTNGIILRSLLANLTEFRPSQRDELVNSALNRKYRDEYAVGPIIDHSNIITPKQREQAVEEYLADSTEDHQLILGKNIDKVEVQFRDKIAQQIINDDFHGPKVQLMINIGSLRLNWQTKLIKYALYQPYSPTVLQTLAQNMDGMHERVRKRFLEGIEFKYPELYKVATCNIRTWKYK